MKVGANRVTLGTSYNNVDGPLNKELEEGKKNRVKKLDQSITLAVDDNENSIFARRNQLKKGAMKIVMDAFAGEQKIDQRIEKHLNKVWELTKEANESSKEIKRLQELQKGLKNDLGIEDDSQEQKDLELLKKAQDISKGYSNESLTKEEIKQLKNMGPLTEYQEVSMDYYKMEAEFKRRMVKSNDAIVNENRTIGAIALARVQIHPIVDAKVEADKILDVASREVTQKLLDEAKDNVDENIEEIEEKAEEVKENKEDREEKIEKDIISKEDGSVNQKIASGLNSADQVREPDIDWNKVEKKMKNLLKAQKLLAEDMKGIEVNEVL